MRPLQYCRVTYSHATLTLTGALHYEEKQTTSAHSRTIAVSYTHLDVYKRQEITYAHNITARFYWNSRETCRMFCNGVTLYITICFICSGHMLLQMWCNFWISGESQYRRPTYGYITSFLMHYLMFSHEFVPNNYVYQEMLSCFIIYLKLNRCQYPSVKDL